MEVNCPSPIATVVSTLVQGQRRRKAATQSSGTGAIRSAELPRCIMNYSLDRARVVRAGRTVGLAMAGSLVAVQVTAAVSPTFNDTRRNNR